MVKECDVVSRHLQGCIPRLCRLRINGLAPASKYWMYRSHAGVYGHSNPCSLLSTGAWLKCTASVVVLGEKLRWVPWATLWDWEVESGALFLRSSASVQPYWRVAKGCYTPITWDTYSLGPYADWAWDVCGMLVRFFLQGVHQFESPQLSDMSNCLFVAIST
jgi:hypothetical protein